MLFFTVFKITYVTLRFTSFVRVEDNLHYQYSQTWLLQIALVKHILFVIWNQNIKLVFPIQLNQVALYLFQNWIDECNSK